MPKVRKTKPVVIRTPYPTPEEVGKLLGVSKKRVRWIKKLVHESIFDGIRKKYQISKKDAETIKGLDIFKKGKSKK